VPDDVGCLVVQNMNVTGQSLEKPLHHAAFCSARTRQRCEAHGPPVSLPGRRAAARCPVACLEYAKARPPPCQPCASGCTCDGPMLVPMRRPGAEAAGGAGRGRRVAAGPVGRAGGAPGADARGSMSPQSSARAREGEAVRRQLEEARAELLAPLRAASMESYARAYPHLVRPVPGVLARRRSQFLEW